MNEVVTSNELDQTTAEFYEGQEGPSHTREMARGAPSLEYIEKRCNSKIVLTTSPFRQRSTLDVWNDDQSKSPSPNEDSSKATGRQNAESMRQIGELEFIGKSCGTSKSTKTADIDGDLVHPDLLTPRRSNLGREDKERVLRNMCRMRTIAGLSEMTITKNKSRSEILLPSPYKTPPNSPEHLRRYISADKASIARPMKLQEYIRGRYSKHSLGYQSVEKFDFYDDEIYEMEVEQEYQEPEVDMQEDDREDRDAVDDSDVTMIAQQFSENASFSTPNKSPMNLHAFVKARGRSKFQIGLLSKYRSLGNKKPSSIKVPVQSQSPYRSTSPASLYDLSHPDTVDELLVKQVRNEDNDDDVEITMTVEDDYHFEDETVGEETVASNKERLPIVSVRALNNAVCRKLKRPRRRLRGLGSKVQL